MCNPNLYLLECGRCFNKKIMYYVTYHSYSEIRRSPIQIELLDRYFQLEIIILNIKIKSTYFWIIMKCTKISIIRIYLMTYWTKFFVSVNIFSQSNFSLHVKQSLVIQATFSFIVVSCLQIELPQLILIFYL